MTSSARAIVFDLDGTLIDSLADLHHALGLTLAEFGAAPASMDEARRFLGHGIAAMVAQARQARELDAAQQPAMVAAMFRHYSVAPAARTRIYPGVVAALTRLQAAGHPLGVCTNKAVAPAQAILVALGLAPFFQVVIGGDSLPQRKPDPAPVLAAFAALGPPLIYVGDTGIDAAAAAGARVPFALFTGGYDAAGAQGLPCRLTFDDWAALPDLLGDLR